MTMIVAAAKMSGKEDGPALVPEVCQTGQTRNDRYCKILRQLNLSRKGVPLCRLAAQAVPVNESIGRGASDFSNRDFSPCCSCDHFVAISAISAVSDCLSVPIPRYLSLQRQDYDWVEDAEVQNAPSGNDAPTPLL